ncbi:MAG: glycosyltransferase family 4 protein [Candidatus Bathyarchaeia archaeon]|nr:glycosyltransferase family 4 protein [Candidatus Bathyarchaeota archaeon]
MRKVGIVHYTAPEKEVGGVEAIIDAHTRHLSKRGFEVHLIYGRGGGLNYENLIEHNVPLLSADHPLIRNVQNEVLKYRKETSNFKECKDNIKEELFKLISKLNTCIIHNIPSMHFNFAATAAINELVNELKRVKFIFWLHDSVLFRSEFKNDVENFPFSILHYKNPNVIYVTPTNVRANQFAQLPEKYKIQEMLVIPNGVDVEEYVKIDEVTKLLMKKLGLSFEDYILVTPVRVTPRKNLELAILVVDELKHLMSSSKTVKLIITGPPDHQARKMGLAYWDYLQELIARRNLQENVIFCHNIIAQRREYENREIKKWSVADVYNIADLIFIPSKEEGFGLPVIEAGASRKPIFCSRIPPFQELIRDDIEGYMFDLNDDPKSIAFRIYREFLTDKVETNFNNVIKRFSWDNIIEKKIIPIL